MDTIKIFYIVSSVALFCVVSTASGQPDKFLRDYDGLPSTLPKEDKDPTLDPKVINDDELLDKLDLDFWPEYMSITNPGVNDRIGPETRPQSVGVSSHLKRLFKQRSKKMRKARKKFFKHKRVILSWLSEATSCRVHYRWKDIGVRNWPRYIKEGYCDTSRSCSVPAGMKCQPEETTNIHILRWYCQGILKRQYCLWVDFNYPIVSKCECRC